MDVRNIDEVPSFTTLDGSEIRELLAYRNASIRLQSLAEARLPIGGRTTPHFHRRTEEIYYIVAGRGLMQIGDESRAVGPGDAIAIPPGAVHTIANVGEGVLKFLCCCAPCYEHADTVLVDTVLVDPVLVDPVVVELEQTGASRADSRVVPPRSMGTAHPGDAPRPTG